VQYNDNVNLIIKFLTSWGQPVGMSTASSIYCSNVCGSIPLKGKIEKKKKMRMKSFISRDLEIHNLLNK
jgi:hypothetical protein